MRDELERVALRETEDRGHAVAARDGVSHALAAQLYKSQRIGKAQRFTCDRSGKGAHRKTRNCIRNQAFGGECAGDRDAGNHGGELQPGCEFRRRDAVELFRVLP